MGLVIAPCRSDASTERAPGSLMSVVSPRDVSVRHPPVVGILSTYPPTACGLATFSAALSTAVIALGASARVVRVADGAASTLPGVVGELENGSPGSLAAAARLLNEADVAIVQHEYGIYGGSDGDEVLQVLEDLQVPAIVVAHTVLVAPTRHQRTVLERAATVAAQVVVMSNAARTRLCDAFDVDPQKVVTIPHGAATPPAVAPTAGRPTLLTWGLLGPGKGIERVIDAMVPLEHLGARPRYVVAGQTHPKVFAADGEAYRNARIEQAWRRGVAASVSVDASYRNVASLTALVQSAAVVVLPYDSTDQVTSGVLVDAIAAGRPVVATAFPHAVELLESGAGTVVDHDDHDALVSAIARILNEPKVAEAMATEARRLAPALAWSVVARAYLALADRLIAERLALV